MKYPILAIDLDGTLLNSHKQIEAANIKAIHMFRKRGGNVIVCSGRSPLATRWISETIGLIEPIISFNGGVIQFEEDNYLDKNKFQGKTVLEVLNICENKPVEVILYTENRLVIPEITSLNSRWCNEIINLQPSGGCPKRQKFYQNKCLTQIEKNLTTYIINSNTPVLKIAILKKGENEEFMHIEKIFRSIEEVEVNKAPKYLELSPKGCSKGSALQKLGSKLGFQMSELAAIGDNHNDLSMLKTAGLGIAMGNAQELVKKRVTIQTDTNDNAGVAKAIYEHLLN
ncbi:Cof-type HAD-IIB family hydrolase [Bacillus mycoides]